MVFFIDGRGGGLWKLIQRITPVFVPVLLITLPLWFFSMLGEQQDYGIARDAFQFIPNPLLDIMGFLKGVFCNLIGYKWFYPLFIGLIISLLLPHRERYKQVGFLIVIVVLPIQVLLISDVMNYYWFIQRQFIWIMPLFAFLLGWCWDSTIEYLWKKLRR